MTRRRTTIGRLPSVLFWQDLDLERAIVQLKFLRGSNHCYALYAHLSHAACKPGDRVSDGQMLELLAQREMPAASPHISTLKLQIPLTSKEEPDGTLRFFTDVHSGKAEELRQDLVVALAYADTNTHSYVAIRGTGRMTRNPQRARELWSIEQFAYYPHGPEDERLGLLTVWIEHAEYWLGPGRASYLVAALKAAVSGVPAGVAGENSQLRCTHS